MSDISPGNISVGIDSYYASDIFDGLIDEVYIYNYALSEDEINTLYNQGQSAVMGDDASRDNDGTAVTGKSKDYCIPGDTAQCDPPVGEWKFDELGGTTAYDTSGNGNDGSFGRRYARLPAAVVGYRPPGRRAYV